MQFQIHAPSQDCNLGVHPYGLHSLLTISGSFYRMLVFSPERNWSTVATQYIRTYKEYPDSPTASPWSLRLFQGSLSMATT